jgi:hypothetical protein
MNNNNIIEIIRKISNKNSKYADIINKCIIILSYKQHGGSTFQNIYDKLNNINNIELIKNDILNKLKNYKKNLEHDEKILDGLNNISPDDNITYDNIIGVINNRYDEIDKLALDRKYNYDIEKYYRFNIYDILNEFKNNNSMS